MLRWLDHHLGGKPLEEIDRMKFDDREKIASAGTANRYLTLIWAILRRGGARNRNADTQAAAAR
jgi:hypothetical protein